MDEVTVLCVEAVKSALHVDSATLMGREIRIDEGPLKGYLVYFSQRVIRTFSRIQSNSDASIVLTAVVRALRDDAGYIASTNQIHNYRGIKVYRPNRAKGLKISAKLLDRND
ncbi:hypothetical protein [Burkholderia pseudomultivorans]|uniref:hypothetical protein n=1 Tax=Burkholderia pseudomultivorans TaxID=1207504 RepID=UPI000754D2D7|nr:hypothetical protein [Burkholderia pseudomultivorans]KVC19724.1 hypothetical protein WS55_22690 [Burkholderia pseudomultivorans]KVC32075.1 hypothetical protein WS56_14295 [Burkholderia pseudomultivorans]